MKILPFLMRTTVTKKKNSRKPVIVRDLKPIWKSPPQYKAQPVRHWNLRYDVSASASVQTLTAAQLASMVGLIATSATTSVFMSDSFRLKCVRLWSWTNTAGTTVDIMLKFPDTGNSAGQGGPPCVKMDSSGSFDDPAFVELKPPKNSTAGLWHDCASTNTTPLLSYLCPQLGTADFDFEFIIDDIGVTPAGPVIAGATLGTIYHHNVATLTAVTPLNGI